MSDYDNDFEDFEGGEDNSPAGLRKALQKAQREAKKAREELAAEREARATAEKAVKKSTLADLLKDAGIDPKFAARADRDGAEATADGVKAWVEENKDFYNFGAKKVAEERETEQAQETETAGDETPQAEIPEGLSPELVEALTASQQLDASGVTPSEVGVLQRLSSIKADPHKKSYEDLVAELAALGAPIA